MQWGGSAGSGVMQWGGSPFRTKVNSDHTVIKVSRGQALIAAHYMVLFYVCCAMQWGGSAGSGGKEYPSHSIYLYNIQGEWWRILVKKPIFHPPDRKKVLKTIKIGPKMGHFMTHARGKRGKKWKNSHFSEFCACSRVKIDPKWVKSPIFPGGVPRNVKIGHFSAGFS